MSLRRIAYVLKVFPKLSETFVAEELAEVRRRGIEVRVLSLSAPRAGLRHDIVADAGLDQITSYPPKDFLAELKEFRPQLLHAHFATEATAAAIELATELELPFTFTAHGYDIHRKAPADFAMNVVAVGGKSEREFELRGQLDGSRRGLGGEVRVQELRTKLL